MKRRYDERPVTELTAVRSLVRDHIDESHARVEELYRLDRDVGFDPRTPADPAALEFAVERIASGSAMLATLWWSAWVASGS